jgi:hypothetical protein
MKRVRVKKSRVGLAALVCLQISYIKTAMAGGVDKVTQFTDNILSIFHAVSLTVVIIALTWTGYKFMYQHASMGECAKILGGGLLIGGAAELAAYLLG